MSSKVQGLLRLTGFFEAFAGVLLVEYAESHAVPSSCPVAVSCGPPFDYGLYNTAGWVLIVIGLIQIVASFFIGGNPKPKPDVVATAGAIKDQTPPASSSSLKEAQKGWRGRPGMIPANTLSQPFWLP
jgi:hypothetical protein